MHRFCCSFSFVLRFNGLSFQGGNGRGNFYGLLRRLEIAIARLRPICPLLKEGRHGWTSQRFGLKQTITPPWRHFWRFCEGIIRTRHSRSRYRLIFPAGYCRSLLANLIDKTGLAIGASSFAAALTVCAVIAAVFVSGRLKAE
jgi:hypothetical protein